MDSNVINAITQLIRDLTRGWQFLFPTGPGRFGLLFPLKNEIIT